MNLKTKESQRKAHKGLSLLRTQVDLKKYPEIKKIADSLQRLMDGASAGGTARAKKLSKKRRKEIASDAANARWAKEKKRKWKITN